MNTAAQYARALFALIEENPRKAATYLHNLDGVLKQRGHQRLLPKIFNEYQKLQLSKERLDRHRTRTPDQERTETLLELYRKLTHTA